MYVCLHDITKPLHLWLPGNRIREFIVEMVICKEVNVEGQKDSYDNE